MELAGMPLIDSRGLTCPVLSNVNELAAVTDEVSAELATERCCDRNGLAQLPPPPIAAAGVVVAAGRDNGVAAFAVNVSSCRGVSTVVLASAIVATAAFVFVFASPCSTAGSTDDVVPGDRASDSMEERVADAAMDVCVGGGGGGGGEVVMIAVFVSAVTGGGGGSDEDDAAAGNGAGVVAAAEGGTAL